MTDVEDEIGWRDELALGAFRGNAVVYFYDLPPGVGRKTMDKLNRLGLVREVNRNHPSAKERCWALVH